VPESAELCSIETWTHRNHNILNVNNYLFSWEDALITLPEDQIEAVTV